MTSFRSLIFTAALVCFAVTPAVAWNATGHKVISAVAYDQLTPAARARVDNLIRRHPDYESIFLRDVPADILADPARKARAAFMNASTWPDIIRGDPRFYNEDRRDAKPTPLLPGFPDMGRHTTWHYRDRALTHDGTPLQQPASPNAFTEIERLRKIIARPAAHKSNPAYALPWLTHLVEDVHNPLHTAARFSSQHPDGDQGGNLVFVLPGRNLHAFWDGLAGDTADWSELDRIAASLSSTTPARSVKAPPETWADEGFVLAWTAVYSFGPSTGTEAQPVMLSPEYQAAAKVLGKNALLAAAQRLADLLNTQLP